VDPAPDDGVNRPKEGTYIYAFDGSRSAADPSAEPVSAPEDAEFESKVSIDGGVIETVEQTSYGSTVATTTYRWKADTVLELSIETKSSAGTAGCEVESPIEVIRIPIKKGKYTSQDYDGTGIACDRTKETEVLRQEDVRDAEGRTWSTWVFEIKTVGRSPGLTEEFTETKWFSPDLGKDIKTETETAGIGAGGKELYRAQTSTLLKRYPT
jgi:hypothetical protein